MSIYDSFLFQVEYFPSKLGQSVSEVSLPPPQKKRKKKKKKGGFATNSNSNTVHCHSAYARQSETIRLEF